MPQPLARGAAPNSISLLRSKMPDSMRQAIVKHLDVVVRMRWQLKRDEPHPHRNHFLLKTGEIPRFRPILVPNVPSVFRAFLPFQGLLIVEGMLTPAGSRLSDPPYADLVGQ